MVTFEQTVEECVSNKEFMKEYKRVTGSRLSLITPCNPLTRMVDEATGFDKKEVYDLLDFIRDYVWKPVVLQITD